MYNTHLYCLAKQAGFYRDVVEMLIYYVRCPRFDPRPGQKVFSIYSPVTFGAQRKITHPMGRSTSMSKTDLWNV